MRVDLSAGWEGMRTSPHSDAKAHLANLLHAGFA